MNCTEVTLPDMLACREARTERIAAALRIKQRPLVSYTMNIAGRVKNSPVIRRGFLEGCRRLETRLAERGFPFELLDERNAPTGCERLYAVAGDAIAIKTLCVNIEDHDKLSRLFDMDVIDTSGRKLPREDLGLTERGCLVCGAPGRGCASRRIHPAEEVWGETLRVLELHFRHADTGLVAQLVTQSLLAEVNVTPKPGLVDQNNNGSHTDMDLPLFETSAAALTPYWGKCFLMGCATHALAPEETFRRLRPLGLEAESAMFSATQGVNTHKGAIFLMGTLCGAIGRLWDRDRPFAAVDDILDECGKMTEPVMEEEFARIKAADHTRIRTAGAHAYHDFRIRGARGEAADGFPNVRNVSLPALRRALARGLSQEYAAAVALLHLITTVEDTNMFKRGSTEGIPTGRQLAMDLIRDDRIPSLEEIEALDRRFMEERLSPGGCADLLAVTLFLHRWEEMRKELCE